MTDPLKEIEDQQEDKMKTPAAISIEKESADDKEVAPGMTLGALKELIQGHKANIVLIEYCLKVFKEMPVKWDSFQTHLDVISWMDQMNQNHKRAMGRFKKMRDGAK